MTTEKFDAIVIGGGPSGATAATLIALDGHKVLLLERERFPRYHVGESLLPSTVHFMTELLGCRDEVLNAGFFYKPGGVYRWGHNPEPWFFDFKEKYHKANYAFQVERSKFDHILLNNARAKGVEVREEHSVVEAIFDDAGRATGVRFKNAAGARETAHGTFLLDATGQAGLLANHIGRREYDEYFKHIAVHAYFENAKRYPDPQRSGAGVFASFKHGWIWYIPLKDNLTGIGAVVHRSEADTIRTLGAEQALYSYIKACPIIQDLLAPATRVTEGDYGKVRIEKDYSYHNKTFWAPGCALVGDSACFVDPILATGVHIATFGALQAARAVNTCLRHAAEISEEAAFNEFEQRYRREFVLFYRYLAGFYEMFHDSESYFWQAHKLLEEGESATSPDAKDSFIQLVAGLGSSGEPLFEDGDAFLDSFRQQIQITERRINVARGEADFTREEMEFMDNDRARTFRGMDETWEIASLKQGKINDGTNRRSARPIFEGGLVPSLDGLAWELPQVEMK